MLQFAGWRRRLGSPQPLRFEAQIDGNRWQGKAWLANALLPPAPHLVGAFAIHGDGQNRRYLAAMPAAGAAPDFHRQECWVEL